MSTASSKVTIAFCHGLWADGSCFNKVIPALQAEGHEVISVQYGVESYEEIATVKRTLNRVSGSVLFVGHSSGGAVITGAGMDDRVVGLVCITAVAPDAGETGKVDIAPAPSIDAFATSFVERGTAGWRVSSGAISEIQVGPRVYNELPNALS